MSASHSIKTLDALAALYGPVNPNSLAKETPALTAEYRRWIERAPFLAIATCGPEGFDCSPRGDTPGHLIRILSDSQIAIPDRRGNNRLDTLKNIVAEPRVALLFLVPGINEALRINGQAVITTDPEHIDAFSVNGKKPASVIQIDIQAVYFQCARALVRSGLWDAESQVIKGAVPTSGQMTKGALQKFDADAYDRELAARQKASLY